MSPTPQKRDYKQWERTGDTSGACPSMTPTPQERAEKLLYDIGLANWSGDWLAKAASIASRAIADATAASEQRVRELEAEVAQLQRELGGYAGMGW